MDVTETLDAMRSSLPGCSLIAFTDLGSKVVLCSSAAVKPAQEEMDKLSALAELMLAGTMADSAAPVIGADDGRAGSAILLSEADAKVFLRSPSDADEALICVCSPEIDLERAVESGRSTLAAIVGAS